MLDILEKENEYDNRFLGMNRKKYANFTEAASASSCTAA